MRRRATRPPADCLAFIENPGERERLRRDSALLDSAVEGILRWTSPVIHFVRTAKEDCEVHGREIRAGERLVLFYLYPSASRDEDVFDEPCRFRIDRKPNRHIAFEEASRLLERRAESRARS